MSTAQLYFAMAGTFIAVFGIFLGMMYKYLDAKFTSIDNQLKFLVEHMVNHSERLATLEERTKKP